MSNTQPNSFLLPSPVTFTDPAFFTPLLSCFSPRLVVHAERQQLTQQKRHRQTIRSGSELQLHVLTLGPNANAVSLGYELSLIPKATFCHLNRDCQD